MPNSLSIARGSRASRATRLVPLLSALVMLATSVPMPALAADTSDQARAAELKRQGGLSMDKLEFAAAEEAYKQALVLTPTDATLHYNLGKVYQARDNYPAALDELEQFAQNASPELRAKVPRILETISEVRQRVATLSIVCTESDIDAQLQLDAVEVARGCSPTPRIVRVSIPHGRPDATLKVGSVKFRAQQLPVSLKPGPVLAFRVDLVARATSGTLRVLTEPMGATIYVDGQVRGNPPVELYLKPGSHQVVAKLDTYNDASVPVIIELDKTKDLTVPLSKGAPITQKWWFWTGVVAVVAAAVIVPSVIAANTEKKPADGSLGQVQAPLRF